MSQAPLGNLKHCTNIGQRRVCDLFGLDQPLEATHYVLIFDVSRIVVCRPVRQAFHQYIKQLLLEPVGGLGVDEGFRAFHCHSDG